VTETTLVGTVYGGGSHEGGVLAPNGMIYFTYNATQILQLDPTTDITSLIGSIYNGTSKWHGGVLAPNGMIYFAQETIHRYLN
jgi:streptogramin lyase